MFGSAFCGFVGVWLILVHVDVDVDAESWFWFLRGSTPWSDVLRT
jgi:hypothetical protein